MGFWVLGFRLGFKVSALERFQVAVEDEVVHPC